MTSELKAAAASLGVKVIRSLPGGLTGGVWLGEYHGRAVVLKPDTEQSYCAEALQRWEGRGAVRLLAAVPGVLVLEQLEPGTTLEEVRSDEDYDAAAVTVTTALWQPCGTIPGLAALAGSWEWQLRGSSWTQELSDAAQMATRLLGGNPSAVLLHGDLHPGNILRDGETWKAVDPQPRRGEAAFDVEPLLRRYLDRGERDRATALPGILGVSTQRTFAWALVRSAWYGAASQLAGDIAREARWRERRALLRELCA